MPIVPRLPRSSHEKTTGGCRNPPNPPLEQCATCVRFTSLGSNAYYQIKTCLDCGHSTRTKRELKPTKDPATCKREDIDRRGSSRYTARFFCKLRGATVDEMPQSEARRRQVAQALATLPSAAVDTAERVVQDEKEDACLTIEGAVQMMHLFQADVETELMWHSCYLGLDSILLGWVQISVKADNSASWCNHDAIHVVDANLVQSNDDAMHVADDFAFWCNHYVMHEVDTFAPRCKQWWCQACGW